MFWRQVKCHLLLNIVRRVIALGVFQTGVALLEANMVHGNRSVNHCDRSDAQPSVLLLELYPAHFPV